MRPGIPSQLVGGPRLADPREDCASRLERPGSLLTEPPYRARLREATRTDWRFLLGLDPGDVVYTGGIDAQGLARALTPWVHGVQSLGPEARGTPDWIFLCGPEGRDGEDALEQAFTILRPGGHLALTFENRFGLHWLADWRTGAADASRTDRRPGDGGAVRHGLRWHLERLARVGAEHVASYALLPSRDAPRAIVPVDPPCPAGAQRMVLDQVWQRATPAAALVRRGLGWLVDVGLMRSLYPHYLLVGRKPC